VGAYNATVRTYRDGELWGTFVAEAVELNGRLQMLRANSIQFTGFENRLLKADVPEMGGKAGDAAYDVFYRNRFPDLTWPIEMDGGEGYRQALRGLALLPTYNV
jgi:hypothetical protein